MRIIRSFKLVVILLCARKPLHRLTCKLAHELISALKRAPCFLQGLGLYQCIEPYMAVWLCYVHSRGGYEAHCRLRQEQCIKPIRAQRR